MRPFSLFWLVFRVSRWLRDHLTRNGIALAILTVFAGALGLNTEVNLAHMVFSLGAGFIALDTFSALWIRRRMPLLSAQRFLPPLMTFGAPSQYRIRLSCADGQTLPALRLQELLKQPLGGGNTVGARGRMNYSAYVHMLRALRVLEIPSVAVQPEPRSTTTLISVSAWPTARGVAGLESLWATVPGILGLVQARIPVTVEMSTQIVLPRPLPAQFPPSKGQRLLHTGGISQTNHVGDSEEFRSLREYRAGDPLRLIHWRSFARTGKPVVREYQQEYFARHALVLDTACGADRRDALEASVSIAAWIATRPLENDCMLDLMFVGDKVHRVSMGRSLGKADTLLRALAMVTEGETHSTDALLRSVAENARQLSSAIVIFQHWDARRQEALALWVTLGLRPTVLLVVSPGISDTASADVDEQRWAGMVHRIAIGSPLSQGSPG